MTVFYNSSFSELLGPSSQLERVATGFAFTEGPIWMADGSLHFSDVVGDQRRRWHPEEGVSIIRNPNNHGNGMTRDANGGLIVCEHVTSRVIREAPDGEITVVASHFQGKELNSPNDVIVSNAGAIIFTDPDWGRTIPAVGLERPTQLAFRGVYCVRTPGAPVQLLVDDFEGPNGLCLSPDERRLFVNDTYRAHIRVFDVGSDFSLSNGSVFADGIGEGVIGQGVVDGMKLDEHGNVYVTGPGGVWVFDQNGNRIGLIEVPEEVGNLNWGGADWRTLFIAASSSIYRIDLNVGGNPLAYMREGRSPTGGAGEGR
ncbi:SMP-30/gluconolactonase/LRE family protein [Burkholderia sp. IMCC1007]|uniref:SMP-30/gluconolactonase/LRE family protein n=1 Tax=Burkholderia sp. IMCC1007 TaxID=3004104 RepID=UPI0022B38039|nr:SMP-30/gluconolactonase/LRE family protein [Burkholderia sp. IMCC1007]